MQDIIAIIYDYVFPNEEKKLKKKKRYYYVCIVDP